MFSFRIPSIFLIHRRNIGCIVRQSNLKVDKKHETPADIAKYIEKCSRLHSENKSVDYERCQKLVDSALSRINQFTVSEVRTIAYNITEIFPDNKNRNWSKTIANFISKRSYMMPVYFLYPLINSVCKMGMKETSFYNKVLPIALERIDEANSIDLATISQTLVLLKKLKINVDSNLVKSIMNSVSKMCLTDRIISEISATNSVLILYSFTKLNIFDEVLFPRLLELIKHINKENFEPHLIPLVLYVLSIFKINDFSCLSVIFEYIIEYSHLMKHENISNCLSSMARLNIRNYAVIRELVQNIKKILPSIRVRELANVMWSLSKLKYDDSDFINDCFNKLKEYDYIDPMSHAQIFETIKRCNLNKKDIVDHLLRKYIPIMRESPTQVITQVAWCCYVLNLDKYSLIEDSLEELSRRELNKVEHKYVNLLSKSFSHCGEEQSSVQ